MNITNENLARLIAKSLFAVPVDAQSYPQLAKRLQEVEQIIAEAALTETGPLQENESYRSFTLASSAAMRLSEIGAALRVCCEPLGYRFTGEHVDRMWEDGSGLISCYARAERGDDVLHVDALVGLWPDSRASGAYLTYFTFFGPTC